MRNRKFRVIITDDDAVSVFILEQLIVKSNLAPETFSFGNAKETLDYLMTNKNEGNIYLIFLDINMPVMNGWEFLEYLTRESVAHVNVIMVSSSVNSSDLDKAKQFKEVVDFWEKPVTHVSFRNFMKSPLFETIKGSLNMT